MEPSKAKRKDSETPQQSQSSEIALLRQLLDEKESQLKERNELITKLQKEATKREEYVSQLETRVAELEHVKVAKLPSENVPHASSEIWARILEYSTYDDVARMAQVSTVFLHQVMPLLKTLYFVSEAALSEATAKRFENGRVEEIIIDCLFYGFGDRYYNQSFRVHEWAKEETLTSFLVAMPTVKNVFFGNGTLESKHQLLERIGLQELTQNKRIVYVPDISVQEEQILCFRAGEDSITRILASIHPSDGDAVRIYKAVIESLCDAYEDGSLPQTMHMFGLPTVHKHDCQSGAGCDLCKAMCKSFPLEQVMSVRFTSSCYFPNKLGNNLKEKLEYLLERPGTKEIIMAKQSELFRDLLQQCEVEVYFYFDSDYSWLTIKYDSHIIDAMKILKLNGCDPSIVLNANMVASDACTRALSAAHESRIRQEGYPYTPGEPSRIPKTLFEMLTNEIGFNLNESDFCILTEHDNQRLCQIWPLSSCS